MSAKFSGYIDHSSGLKMKHCVISVKRNRVKILEERRHMYVLTKVFFPPNIVREGRIYVHDANGYFKSIRCGGQSVFIHASQYERFWTQHIVPLLRQREGAAQPRQGQSNSGVQRASSILAVRDDAAEPQQGQPQSSVQQTSSIPAIREDAAQPRQGPSNSGGSGRVSHRRSRSTSVSSDASTIVVTR